MKKENSKEIRYISRSHNETKKLASILAKQLKGGDLVCLIGDLGAGKTYFVKFLGEYLGIDPKGIISPTFVYWKRYKGKKININHFDLYRVDDKEELLSIGIEDALVDNDAITVIEWADKVISDLPNEKILIEIKELSEDKREFIVKLIGDRYLKIDLELD